MSGSRLPEAPVLDAPPSDAMRRGPATVTNAGASSAQLDPRSEAAPERALTPAALGVRDSDAPLWIAGFELRSRTLRLTVPFATAAGRIETLRKYFCTLTLRDERGELVQGTGEASPLPAPFYDGECHRSVAIGFRFIRASLEARRHEPLTGVQSLIDRYRWILGHRIARAAVEGAWWDAQGRRQGLPVWRLWGGTRPVVATGTSIGLTADATDLLDRIARALDEQGVRRVKLKIAPGRDLRTVAAVRRRYPDLPLQVDANGAYDLFDPHHLDALRALDDYDLLMIEQPGPPDDFLDHARQLAGLRTPICLDESILSATQARQAIAAFAACSTASRLVINIKPARVGGYLEALRIAALCGRFGVSTWCGGLFESALGKTANLHFATRAEVDLPGDHVAQGPYFLEDVAVPPAVRDGLLAPPAGAGWGLAPLEF